MDLFGVAVSALYLSDAVALFRSTGGLLVVFHTRSLQFRYNNEAVDFGAWFGAAWIPVSCRMLFFSGDADRDA